MISRLPDIRAEVLYKLLTGVRLNMVRQQVVIPIIFRSSHAEGQITPERNTSHMNMIQHPLPAPPRS